MVWIRRARPPPPRSGQRRSRPRRRVTDAWATLGQQLVSIASSVTALGVASAKVWTDANAATTASAEAQLDAALQTAGVQTRFGTYRRFYSSALLKAELAMTTARYDAIGSLPGDRIALRRRQPTMFAPEPSVAAPSTWADQIYGSDLAPLGVVGVSISGASPLNTDFLTQYVSNLGQFMSGYFAGRATGGVNRPGDVITLPGPDGRVTDRRNSIMDPASLAWVFQCSGSSTWFVNPASRKVPRAVAEPPSHRMCR